MAASPTIPPTHEVSLRALRPLACGLVDTSRVRRSANGADEAPPQVRMAFSSLLFLSLCLPAYVLLYWAAPRSMRNTVILTLSLFFYAWGAPWFLPVILGLGVTDYWLAIAIADRRTTRPHQAKQIVTLAVTVHLSILAYFKYSNFFVGELSTFLARFGGRPIPWTNVALPIGISFLTFEEISYVVDVYRGDAKPARSLPKYLLFLMLFPHSIAGPIFRWKDLEAQLQERKETIDDVVDGLSRFVWGLGKKILLADAAAITADAAFSVGPNDVTFRLAWLGATAYAIQIFYDFSGYSDMAIGLGRIAGFRFKENFNDPYTSSSITEFWTRWHISLSSWLRDYLYIPLGGNRQGEARTRLHVLIVFALSGLWHGAAWTFVLWGLYHGFLTVLERTKPGRWWRAHAPRFLAIPLTLALAVVGWVFFRATSADQAFAFLRAMVGMGPTPAVAPLLDGHLLPRRSIVFMVAGLGIVVLRAILGKRPTAGPWRWGYLAMAPVVFVFALLQVANTKFVPLIYFKF